MKKITATDTLELSIPERIQLVEDIWDTLQNHLSCRSRKDNSPCGASWEKKTSIPGAEVKKDTFAFPV